jgi:type II secretory pathway pseudopilin PulG
VSDDRPGEAGFALAALLVSLSIMLLAMSAAVPTWRYIIKDDKEQELIFRGNQIADAIQRFQAKNGNAAPPSLEVLVKGKFLRKAYKDPMAKDGEWRLIHLGETVGAPAPGVVGTAGSQTGPGASPTRQPSQAWQRRSRFGTAGQALGGIVGVASTSEEEGLRLYNGRSKYSEWVFGPNQPCVVGSQPVCTRSLSTGIQPGRDPKGPGLPGLGPQQPRQQPPLPGGPSRPRSRGGTG